MIDSWELTVGGHTYRVRTEHDRDSSPYEHTDIDESREYITRWRDGSWYYVEIIVSHPDVRGEASLWGVGCGAVTEETHVGQDEINDYVPDLVTELLAMAEQEHKAQCALLEHGRRCYG